jgi:hypothetical protein
MQTGDRVYLHEESERSRAFVNLTVAQHFSATDGTADLIEQFERRSGKAYTTMAKSAIAAMDSTSALAALQPLATAFLAVTDRVSIISDLLAAGAVSIPLSTTVRLQIMNVTGKATGEGAVKAFGEMAFESPSDPPEKVVGQVAFSTELLRSLDATAQNAIRQALSSALAAAIDTKLVTYFTSGSPVSGTTVDTETIGELLGAISGGKPKAPVIIGAIDLLIGAAGKIRDIKDLGVRFVTTPDAGSALIAVDAAAVLFADSGVELSASRSGSVVLDDGEGAPSETVVSLFQYDLVALKAERYLQIVARPDAFAHAAIA